MPGSVTAVDFERLNALFDRAIELAPQDRKPFLSQACADDPALVDEVLALLDADEAVPESFLTLSAEYEVPDGIQSAARLPERIGPYRVVREIGRGGMGVVYEAEQSEPDRRVAVKVIRRGLVDDELSRRFRREARVLGQLKHAGIAHIYEAGSATVGDEQWPYFAMEYIEGPTIEAYIEAAEAGTRERLELMVRVCAAVEHAHERGVVHRDLKPANILVVRESDGAAQPKILDFGVARVTDPDGEGTQAQTHTGQIIGTLGYMSPEQLLGDRAVDARADVYALGVILFRLLAGRLPFDIHKKPVAEVARVVQDEEPTRLGSIDTRWRGDLETIVTKALEKDPEHRYASARALAEDLRRHLAEEPIVARAPSTWYRAAKFARRNRGLVGGLAATFAALVVGLVVATAALVRANEARDAKEAALVEERRARESAEAVTSFLADMMAAARPEAQGKDVPLRTVLANAANELETKFDAQPLVKARLYHTLGLTYASLGVYETSRENLEHSIEIWEREVGEADGRTIDTLVSLGATNYFLGKRQQSAKVYERAYRLAQTTLPADDAILIRALAAVGFIRMQTGRYQEAETAYLKALEYYDARAPDHVDALGLRLNLAVMLTRLRRYEEAEPIYTDLIERAKRVLGPEHPETLLAIANLAAQYNRTGRAAKALPLLANVLEVQERVLGDAHSKTLITRNNLAVAHTKVGGWKEGEQLLRDGLAKAKATYGEEGPSTLMFTHSLGRLLRQRGDLAAAEAVLVPSLALHERVYKDRGAARLKALAQLVELRIDQKKLDEAIVLGERLTKDAIDSAKRHEYRALLARAYVGEERFEDAERCLLASVEGEKAPDEIVKALVDLYENWGRRAEAQRWATRRPD